ncbi:hypothetical protein INT47_009909 [Mucor saturninus]|uniref:Uncharacterized protein n=1 Tax=Mucor saturninus TaxID=64648 RepID=A0A8H7UVW0_9FUNG|nr:hypothetical protein INT47_009909 [Mucor saturninus]
MTPRLARQFFTLWYHIALRDSIANSQAGRYCPFLKVIKVTLTRALLCFSDNYAITATDVQIEAIMTAFDTIEPDTEALKALDILVLEKWDIWILSVTEDRVNEIHIKDFLIIINPGNPTGQCLYNAGRCGGYFECVNLDNHVLEHIYKLASVTICPNIHGQIMVDLMYDPPHEGQVSYPLYQSEIASIYNSLKRHSKKLETVLN